MRFRGDEHAQSVVIGSLLVFTIIILSFSGYQAVVVPNQNAQVEADHFQDVEAQFSELRSNVINAVGENDTRSTTIHLGTGYPARTFALNPPPAAGTLETTGSAAVTVTDTNGAANVCAPGGGTSPTTRSLVYRPNYNEYQPPEAIAYENRVISREFQDGTLFDQRMVNSNTNRISLYLFTGSVSENGVKPYTLELNGSRQYTETLTDPTITVPSRYIGTVWDDEILDGQTGVSASDVGDRVNLTFSGDWTVSCAVVGLDSDPAFTPPSEDGGSGDDGDTGINPNAPGDIRLNGVTDKSASTIELDFKNLADTDTDIVEARINFYQSQSGTVPTEADFADVVAGTTGPTLATLTVRGPFEDVTPPLTVEGDQVSTVSLDFDQTVNPNDWFVLTMQYDNDEVGRYFISARDTAATSPVGGGGTSGLRGATVDSIGTGEGEQNVTVTLGRDLTTGEMVTIDLADPQANNQVDYSGATADTGAPGTATFTTQRPTDAEITYTASGSESDGDTVTVTVSGLDASGSQAANNSPYDVVFTGPDGGTITEEFTVS